LVEAHEVLTELWVVGRLTAQDQATLAFIETHQFGAQLKVDRSLGCGDNDFGAAVSQRVRQNSVAATEYPSAPLVGDTTPA